ncbi:MAG: FKBP-type peptidyl-prolyl cis-trans isomerase [Bacteroidales bacterium]|jgi:peptidylprolyl isomerase
MYKTRLNIILLLVLTVLAAGGCRTKYRKQESSEKNTRADQETLFRSNQLVVKQIAKSIREKAAIEHWNLTETGTGVFYQVFHGPKKNQSLKILPGDRVSLTFRLSLFDGRECYSSYSQGPKQFIVEKSEAESGLHETIQFLHPGDSALIIIPPYRAFGLTGDGNKIPPGAILVYNIRVDSVIRPRKN